MRRDEVVRFHRNLARLRKPDSGYWTHPVIANGRLYLRDQDHLYCYDVSQH
jgi:hypothetical protein